MYNDSANNNTVTNVYIERQDGEWSRDLLRPNEQLQPGQSKSVRIWADYCSNRKVQLNWSNGDITNGVIQICPNAITHV